MLPNFIIIGAMKSGTSSLYEYLRAHEEVFMSPTKEPDFFASADIVGAQRNQYEGLFEGSRDCHAIGEASTSYTKYPEYPDVAGRIASLIPHARLIYLVRQPIARMRSQYLHELLKSRDPGPIETALLQDPRYINYSSYWMQLRQYLVWFPATQLLVLDSDSLRLNRREALARVCKFLEIDPMGFSANVELEYYRSDARRANRQSLTGFYGSGAYRVLSRAIPDRVKGVVRPLTSRRIRPDSLQLSPEVEARLGAAIRDDVVQLASFLGPGFDGWGLI